MGQLFNRSSFRPVRPAVVALMLIFASTATLADEARDARMNAVNSARLRGDLGDLLTARSELEAALKQPGNNAAEIHYDLAYVNWRILQIAVNNKESDSKREQLIKDAHAHIDAILAIHPDDIETSILKGALVGTEADESFFSRLRLGRISYDTAHDNLKREPDNPRVRLQWGVILFFAPSFAGGGVEESLEHLEAAKTLFGSSPDPGPWPNWGREENLAWLGVAHAKAGRLDRARHYFDEALAREPNYGWVLNVHVPALEEQLAN